MRPAIALICALILVPAAVAATRTQGDGVLELNAVNATRVTINGTHGAIWGQIDKGVLRVVDLNPADDNEAFVSGAKPVVSTVDPSVTTYTGKNLRFRFAGGRYRFVMSGQGIDITAVGVGSATLVGDPAADDDGQYAVDDGDWLAVLPLKMVVPFGIQPVAGP